MIVGIGTDITEISRVRRILESKSGGKFAERILTGAELSILAARPERRAEFVAGRFAAKEAVVKALGCGIGETVGFQDIEIKPDKHGKPEAVLSTAALIRLDSGGDGGNAVKLHVTISHADAYAVAFAVVEKMIS